LSLSAKHTLQTIREKIEKVDFLNGYAPPLAVTYNPDEAGKKGFVHAPEVLIPSTETLSSNWRILQSKGVKFTGEDVPKNRITGLLVKTETLQANIGFLEQHRVDLKDAGDILGANTDDLKKALSAIRGDPIITTDKIRKHLE
jgi:hypothetical protein